MFSGRVPSTPLVLQRRDSERPLALLDTFEPTGGRGAEVDTTTSPTPTVFLSTLTPCAVDHPARGQGQGQGRERARDEGRR